MDVVAKIFGYILGDGWIDINEVCGVSGDAFSLINIITDINNILQCNVCSKIITRAGGSEKYRINGVSSSFRIHHFVTKDFIRLGMPIGKRVYQDYSLPQWIVNGDDDIKWGFMSGYYAAEGYIPSLQKNNETPKALNFCFSKDLKLYDSAIKLANQFCSILNDLKLTSTLNIGYEETAGPRVKINITIGNSKDHFVNALSNMDLDYSISKETRRRQLLTYFSLKEQKRQELLMLHNHVKELKINHTYNEIANLTGLTVTQVYNIICGKNKCHQVRNFPKFTQEFISQYCSTETPLIRRNPYTGQRRANLR